MVVARRRAQRRLIVGKILRLVVRLVVVDELLDLRLGVLRLLEILRDIGDVVVDVVLVLERRTERPANEPELGEIGRASCRERV